MMVPFAAFMSVQIDATVHHLVCLGISLILEVLGASHGVLYMKCIVKFGGDSAALHDHEVCIVTDDVNPLGLM